ncbi:MAG: hypothetical protein C4554_03875 [Dethiobacter sp.]|nr:MAG: hypothetical protein C4554_03875 [Dethiobacter sp.]
MIRDWFAYLVAEQQDVVKGALRQGEKASGEKSKLIALNPHLFYHLIALTQKKSADKLRSTWQNTEYKDRVSNLDAKIDAWGLRGLLDVFRFPDINMAYLPFYSFVIRFTFTLAKPYVSRDEQVFYIIDNPVSKDKMFGLPHVIPSSWKGCLRSAIYQLGADQDALKRIFGSAKEAGEYTIIQSGKSGTLHFYPTFFMQKSLEVINPHDRVRKVGKRPVLMECVPAGASGCFTLLYVPALNSMSNEKNDVAMHVVESKKPDVIKDVTKDLRLISEGLKAMFLTFGFGAKTSSGYGIATPDLDNGQLTLKASGIKVTEKKEQELQAPEDAFQKYLLEDGTVRAEFLGQGEAGLLSNSEYGIKKPLDGGSLAEFKRFRNWYRNFGEKWSHFLKESETSGDRWPGWTFQDYDGLVEVAGQIERLLQLEKEEKQ